MSHDAGQGCVCLSEHRPAPLELHRHHVWPLNLGGPDTPEAVVWCCPTSHTNIHEVLRMMIAGGRLTYAQVAAMQVQPVNRYAYSLALRGYDLWMAAPVS